MPRAAPSRPRGTIRNRIDIVIAGRIPPRSAWTIRKITRVSKLQASPHSADPPANPINAQL